MAFVKGRARVKLEKALLREEVLEALHFDGIQGQSVCGLELG